MYIPPPDPAVLDMNVQLRIRTLLNLLIEIPPPILEPALDELLLKVQLINLAFELGKRGNLSKTLIKERYLKFIVGSSINNIWYIKRKFD